MASIAPMAMLFLRSPGGISHQEAVNVFCARRNASWHESVNKLLIA
jgi:hypothetical protein